MAPRRVTTPAARRNRQRLRPKGVHQFLVALSQTDPLVWRRIQVPEHSSFWDLHVAIQDAMGWLDSTCTSLCCGIPGLGANSVSGSRWEDFPDERPVCRTGRSGSRTT